MSELGVEKTATTTGTPRTAAEPVAENEAAAITFDRVGVAYGRGKKATNALTDFNLRVAPGET
ncbi:MAG: 2-aminoethylphosphonate transport system ATP-binding protein, partial [Mycobacterium sp.]|nr:2-aminoethylphosphonate transport system ATP-binding protein [Mycobacterium sp.]